MSQYIHAYDSANKRVKAVAVDTDGHLQVDVVSMTGGGDSTAAHQVTNHSKLDTLATKLDTIDSSINVIENAVSAGEMAVAHNGLTELDNAINSAKLDVNIASDSSSLASSAHQVTSHSKLDTLGTKLDAIKPDHSQSTLASAAAIASGANSSEIDMDGYKHLTIYGSSSVNFGSLCLIRRATSSGTDFLDGSNIISASDPTGGSNYHFSATFKNVGNRYLAFRNMDSSTQTVTLYVVKHR